jgi:hypothetical protein
VLDDRGGALDVRLGRAADLASDALRPTSTELADRAKERLSNFALEIAGRRDAVDAVRATSALKRLAWIVPLVAVALFLFGVVLARKRAIGWAWAGTGLCAAGLATSAFAVLGRDQITVEIASVSQAAVHEVWDVIVGDLRWWGLIASAVGAVLATCAAVTARRRNQRRAVWGRRNPSPF